MPEVDCTDYPRGVGIGNNCRFAAYMVKGITFNDLYDKSPWKDHLETIKNKLDAAVADCYLAPDKEDPIRRLIEALQQRLNNETCRDLLERFRSNWPNDVESRCYPLKMHGFFQPFFHVPDLPAQKQDVRNTFPRFLERVGTLELKDFFCRPRNDADIEPHIAVIEAAKRAGICQIHRWCPFGVNENIFPGGCSGTEACRLQEEQNIQRMAEQHEIPLDSIMLYSSPNGWCCDTSTNTCENLSQDTYCEEVDGVCNVMSEPCI